MALGSLSVNIGYQNGSFGHSHQGTESLSENYVENYSLILKCHWTFANFQVCMKLHSCWWALMQSHRCKYHGVPLEDLQTKLVTSLSWSCNILRHSLNTLVHWLHAVHRSQMSFSLIFKNPVIREWSHSRGLRRIGLLSFPYVSS